jgi:hypothetical protein
LVSLKHITQHYILEDRTLLVRKCWVLIGWICFCYVYACSPYDFYFWQCQVVVYVAFVVIWWKYKFLFQFKFHDVNLDWLLHKKCCWIL